MLAHQQPAPAAPASPPRLPPPVDAYFERWLATDFVWLPERGMGRLRVTEAPYDAAYFGKYEGYAATPMGRAITAARVELVRRFVAPFEILVDVGIGCGDFLLAVREHGYNAWGYDVNPAGIEWLRERWALLDPYLATSVRALTLWDALEHIPDPGALLARVRPGGHVFVSLPVVPGDGPPRADWKHLRRDEHCWYWTGPGFVGWMREHGFELLSRTDVETELGREDIQTFAFRRAP